MKTFLALLAITAALPCWVDAQDHATTAQTNFFAVLVCSNRTYTNATIDAVTPASVSVSWDDGVAQVPMTELPANLQTLYHYDAKAAQKFLDAKAAKKAAVEEQTEEALAAIEASKTNLGPVQKVRIVKVYTATQLQIESEGKVTVAYIHKLPSEIFRFIHEYEVAKENVAELQNQVSQDQSTPAPSYSNRRSRRGGSANAQTPQTTNGSANANLTSARAALTKAQTHLAELQKEYESRVTISARPSEYVMRGGVRQWEFESKDAGKVE